MGALDTTITCAETLADRVEFEAASHYSNGLHCGESVVRAINDVLDCGMPQGFERVASGFCEGLGGSRCICGALAGGVMACGLLAGRTGADQPWEPSYFASAELRRRWIEDQEAETCAEIAQRHGGMGHPQRWAHCTALVGRTARWVAEIAEENGWR